MRNNLKNNRRLKWCLSFILLAGFLISFYVHQTGLGLHQWIGVGCGVVALLHLILHWAWVKAVVKSLVQHSRGPKRYVIVNASLLIGFLIIGITGLAMATWFDLELPGYAIWRVVHTAVSLMVLWVVLLKIMLHRRWIVATAKVIFNQPVAQPTLPQPSPVVRSFSRREFLTLVGLLGPVAILTFARTLDTLLIAAELKREKTKLCYTFRRCGAKCHFPGNCYLYVDENKNKRCDWGECA